MSKTQKKIYVASSNATSSSRLFKSVGDFSHCKNLFGKANHALHFAAEEIYGSSLRRSELFLHLRCRPGKRRLKNFSYTDTNFRKSHILRTSPEIYRGVTLRASIVEDFQSNTRLSGSRTRRGLDFELREPNSKLKSGCNVW